jgi:DNA-binding CsgD family transcriptional regulator
VVARDPTRRQVLVELALLAGLDVAGVYPAWHESEADGVVAIVDGETVSGDLPGPAVVVGSERPFSRFALALLPRDPAPAQLGAAAAAVAAGLNVTAPGTAHQPLPDEDLTAREHEVLGLLADGLSNRAIAAALAISENTVKFHVASILAKLAAQTRAEAVMNAVRRGLLPL